MFRNPQFLWLLPFALIPIYNEWRRRSAAAFGYSAVTEASARRVTARVAGRRSLCVFRAAAIALAVIALARPQSGDEQSRIRVEGIAIELVVDISGSMEQADMVYEGAKMTRLDAVKRVLNGFVRGRGDDVIGVTAFSAYPNEICPLTLDHDIIPKFLEQLRPDRIFPYTAIGDGIVHGASAIKESTAKSKVMILLTDGLNNFGAVNPVEAARLASDAGVKIYTIGIVPGSAAQGGNFLTRAMFSQGSEVDEETLNQVALTGGGQYFAASDGDKLKKIYDEIDRLEKTPQISEKFLQYRELYHTPLAGSLGLIFVETIFALTIFRIKP